MESGRQRGWGLSQRCCPYPRLRDAQLPVPGLVEPQPRRADKVRWSACVTVYRCTDVCACTHACAHGSACVTVCRQRRDSSHHWVTFHEGRSVARWALGTTQRVGGTGRRGFRWGSRSQPREGAACGGPPAGVAYRRRSGPRTGFSRMEMRRKTVRRESPRPRSYHPGFKK